MPHLDEGQLHAYLDDQLSDGTTGERGAVEHHLAECAECRSKLETERRVRDQVQAVLRATGPAAVSPPPFEAVLKRAAQQRARPFGMRRMVALAWAASLALALTVGWYARSLILVKAEPGAAAGAAAAAETPAAGEQLQAKAIQAGPLTSTAGPAGHRRDVANLATAQAKAAVDTEAERHVAEAPAPAVPSAPALRRQAEPREAELHGAAPALPGQAWVTVTAAEAERRLGGPLATIPGLPSLGTSVYGAGEAVVARTIQVLGPGQAIELVQQRAAAPDRERAAAPSAQAGRTLRDEPGVSVTVQWEGFSVTGRALVPADSLRKLLDRLR